MNGTRRGAPAFWPAAGFFALLIFPHRTGGQEQAAPDAVGPLAPMAVSNVDAPLIFGTEPIGVLGSNLDFKEITASAGAGILTLPIQAAAPPSQAAIAAQVRITRIPDQAAGLPSAQTAVAPSGEPSKQAETAPAKISEQAELGRVAPAKPERGASALGKMTRELFKPGASADAILRQYIDGQDQTESAAAPSSAAAPRPLAPFSPESKIDESAGTPGLVKSTARDLTESRQIKSFARSLILRQKITRKAAAEAIFANLPAETAATEEAWSEAVYRVTGWAWAPSKFSAENVPGAFNYVVKDKPAVVGALTVLHMARRWLNRNGVKTERDYNKYDRLVISPEGDSPLNRFAASLERRYSTELEFSPQKLMNISGYAYFVVANGKTRLGISPINVMHLRPFSEDRTQIVIPHELLHLMNHQRLVDGNIEPIHGRILNLNFLDENIPPTYAKSFSLDELDTYDQDWKLYTLKARASYLRSPMGASLDDPIALLSHARSACKHVMQFGENVEKADAHLLNLAAAVRADASVRFIELPEFSDVAMMEIGNASVVLQGGYIKVRFHGKSGLSYNFHTTLTKEASAREIADTLERQARGLDAIIADKMQTAKIAQEDMDTLHDSLLIERLRRKEAKKQASPAAYRKKTTRAFNKLVAIGRANPTTAAQRARVLASAKQGN